MWRSDYTTKQCVPLALDAPLPYPACASTLHSQTHTHPHFSLSHFFLSVSSLSPSLEVLELLYFDTIHGSACGCVTHLLCCSSISVQSAARHSRHSRRIPELQWTVLCRRISARTAPHALQRITAHYRRCELSRQPIQQNSMLSKSKTRHGTS